MMEKRQLLLLNEQSIFQMTIISPDEGDSRTSPQQLVLIHAFETLQGITSDRNLEYTVQSVLVYTFYKHTPGLTQHFQFPQRIFLYIRPVLREEQSLAYRVH